MPKIFLFSAPKLANSGQRKSALIRILIAACFVLLLSACALIRDHTDPTTVSIRGVPPTLEQLNVSASTTAQHQLVYDLIQVAGFAPGTQLAPYDDNWSLVMRAGVFEIGRQCDQYLDVLFRFNREQQAGRQDLAAAAAATGAIMGLSGVSVKAIAITAAAFGLATSLFDASVNSVLFTIEPSALRNVALQGRINYLVDLRQRRIDTRPDMLIALQGYLTQCSPAAIEANINNAASGAPSVAVASEAPAAAALAAPATTLLQLREIKSHADQSSKVLKKWLFPDFASEDATGRFLNVSGKPAAADSSRLAQLRDWQKRNGLNIPIPVLLRASELAATRTKIISDLKIQADQTGTVANPEPARVQIGRPRALVSHVSTPTSNTTTLTEQDQSGPILRRWLFPDPASKAADTVRLAQFRAWMKQNSLDVPIVDLIRSPKNGSDRRKAISDLKVQ